MIYLASPFTHHPLGHEAAFIEVSRLAAQLVERGHDVYSPIMHSYPLALYGGLPMIDVDLWRRVDAPFVALCSSCVVAMMEGWQQSQGVAHEIDEFGRAGKSIRYLDPATMDITDSAHRRVA